MPRPPLPLSWAGRPQAPPGGHYRGRGGDSAHVHALWSLVLAHYRQFVFAEQRASLRKARAVWATALAVLAVTWLYVDARVLAVNEALWFGLLTTTTAGFLAAVEAARLRPPSLPNPAAKDIDACPECSAPARRSGERCPLCGTPLVPGVGAGRRVQTAVMQRFGLPLHRPWPYARWAWSGGGSIALGFAVLLVLSMARRGALASAGELDLVWPLVAAALATIVFTRSLAQSLADARALRHALGQPLVVTAARELQVLGTLPGSPPAALPSLTVALRTAPSAAARVEGVAAGLFVLALVAPFGLAPTGGLALIGLALLSAAAYGRRTRVTLGPDGVRARSRFRREVFAPREDLRAIACSPRATRWSVGAIDHWELVAVTRSGDEVALARVSDAEAERGDAAARLDAALRPAAPTHGASDPERDLSASTG